VLVQLLPLVDKHENAVYLTEKMDSKMPLHQKKKNVTAKNEDRIAATENPLLSSPKNISVNHS